MFFFEYIIKLLMGNSNTLFLGLVMVVFGYYGWLLFQINSQLKDNKYKWVRLEENLQTIMNKLEKLDELYYKELSDKIKDSQSYLKELNSTLNCKNLTLEKLQDKIIAEVKEESEEVKDTVKILLGGSRSMDKKNGDPKQEPEE